ncbi:hypothetical protein [Shewanella sp.]|uniref:hypothetical protein n=1 Tax=Shewanella sp. TaxID=50422 RepID=UPI004047A5CE
MNKGNKKGCVYLGGSDAAQVKALDKAIKRNFSPIRVKELPNALKRISGDFCSHKLLKLVYNKPLINTHQINEILGVSNSHDISKKLSKRLAKAGYEIVKLPLNGTKKPYCWLLRRLENA